MSESRERRGTAVAANETKKTKSFYPDWFSRVHYIYTYSDSVTRIQLFFVLFNVIDIKNKNAQTTVPEGQSDKRFS